MPYDPMLDGYQGRNFKLPPMGRGVGRFREDIVIGENVEDAVDWLSDADAHRQTPGLPRVHRPRPRQAVHLDPEAAPEWVDTDKPYKVGEGPPTCSTTTSLAVWPMYKFDTNGYYGIFGVSPWCSKVELRLAYQELLNRVTDSAVLVRATYCFKQLINAEIRREYDGTPMGELYMDSWEMQRIRDLAKAEAIRRRQARGEDMSDTDATDEMIKEVMDEDGWEIDDEDGVDSKPEKAQDASWQYAYYRLRSTSFDRPKLAEWQSLLISTVATRGESIRLAVGFHRDSVHPWKVMQVGELVVAFLRDTEQPTREAAEKCATLLISLSRTPRTSP